MAQIPYQDGHQEEKIAEAVRCGLMTKSIDPDGIVRYTLTPMGQQRYAFEKIFGTQGRRQ